eukprot:Em0313g2a
MGWRGVAVRRLERVIGGRRHVLHDWLSHGDTHPTFDGGWFGGGAVEVGSGLLEARGKPPPSQTRASVLTISFRFLAYDSLRFCSAPDDSSGCFGRHYREGGIHLSFYFLDFDALFDGLGSLYVLEVTRL